MSCDPLPLKGSKQRSSGRVCNSIGMAKSRFGFDVGCSLLSISALGTCQTVPGPFLALESVFCFSILESSTSFVRCYRRERAIAKTLIVRQVCARGGR